jgi:hypothetical protein
MRLKLKACIWGEEKNIQINGHILFENNILYDVVGSKREKLLKYIPGLWFDNDNDSYESFEIKMDNE